MNKFQNIVVLLATVATVVFAATDYCNKDLCPYGKHIACGHNNRFSTSCPADAKLVEITPQLQTLIVDKMNEKRNFIAGGGDRNHKPACRMGTMQWDAELAKLAELNVKQCEMKHDSCHNTNSYHLSGQNLAWLSFTEQPNHTEKLTDSVQMWYDEVKNSNMNIINKFPGFKGPTYGHFTAMMFDRNVRVGCAVSTYTKKGEKYKAYLVACNMAYTNMLGTTVYSSCSAPGSGCKTGKNPKYSNLCSTSEEYDVNGY